MPISRQWAASPSQVRATLRRVLSPSTEYASITHLRQSAAERTPSCNLSRMDREPEGEPVHLTDEQAERLDSVPSAKELEEQHPGVPPIELEDEAMGEALADEP